MVAVSDKDVSLILLKSQKWDEIIKIIPRFTLEMLYIAEVKATCTQKKHNVQDTQCHTRQCLAYPLVFLGNPNKSLNLDVQ